VTQSDPTGQHDWHSADYVENWIDVNSPLHDGSALLRRIAHLVPFDPGDAIRVLDIGGGWGPVTAVMLETFPNARVVLHDFSEPMLAEARRRLANHGDSVRYHLGDLMTPSWAQGLDDQFDAIVSHIAIHNVRFPDRIRAIYHETFELVAPGGCFINLDHPTNGELSRRAARHSQDMDRRRELFEQTGRWTPLADLPTPSRSGRNPRAEGEARHEDVERIASHEPATVANQLNWLREAGFDEADCFWLERRDALIGAFRR
jgi:tRNA (cmo5U34)-methyltransferase